MAAPSPEARMTPAEYLAREREAEARSEYIAGAIVARSGASPAHNQITANLSRVLGNQLVNRDCAVYTAALRVRAGTGRPAYLYPDAVVTCGEPQLEDAARDTLLNPTVIVEVLAPDTEQYDRGTKFMAYRALESLQEVLLIAQDAVQIEHYVRQRPGWMLQAPYGWADTVPLRSVGCAVPVAEIYRKVDLAPTDG